MIRQKGEEGITGGGRKWKIRQREGETENEKDDRDRIRRRGFLRRERF